MRRAWTYGWLCLTLAGCAGLLGIDEVAYSSETNGSNPEGGTAEDGAPLFDGPGGDSPVSDGGGPCNADLARDPENCGSCGHSCGAGVMCADSLCVPELVLSGLSPPPIALARVAGATYVSSSHRVHRCAATTCGADAGPPLYALELAGDYAITSFFADDAGMLLTALMFVGAGIPAGRIDSCPLGPCPTPTVLAPSEINVQAVARTETDVLWARDADLFARPQLVSCPGGSCGGVGDLLATSMSGPGDVTSIAPRGASILWMAGQRLLETKRAVGGATLLAVIASGNNVAPFARDVDHVYFGNFDTRSIEQCDISPTCQQTRGSFVAAGGTVRAISVDGAFVYMVVDTPTDGGSQGFVGRAPKGPSPKLEVLARSNPAVRAMALDATHLYWADQAGSVWRVRK